jgi:hypothetical protein
LYASRIREQGVDRRRVSFHEVGHLIHVKVPKVETFSFTAILEWVQNALARGREVISGGLACFRAVAEVGLPSSASDR